MQEVQLQCRPQSKRTHRRDPSPSHFVRLSCLARRRAHNGYFGKRLIAFISTIYAQAVLPVEVSGYSSMLPKAYALTIGANRAPNLAPRRKSIPLGYIPTAPPQFPFTHNAGFPPVRAVPPRVPAIALLR